MATLSVTVPDAMVPTLVQVATTYLTGIGVDLTGMTQAQIGKRYIAERLKADYIAQVTANQTATSGQEIIAANTQAKTDAAGIS